MYYMPRGDKLKLSRKEQWVTFSVINAVLLISLLLFPIYLHFAPVLPLNKCGLLEVFHLYCPACGGTRALNALLHFDIINSIIYNPMVIISFVMLILYEIGMIKYLIKGIERELLIKPWHVYVILGIWVAYSILRNVLLIWGIDIVGDVIPPMP